MTGGRAPGRVADHAREIADQENDGMRRDPENVSVFEENRVAQMKIRRGRVEARLHFKWLTGREGFLEFRFQFALADDLQRILFLYRRVARRPEGRVT